MSKIIAARNTAFIVLAALGLLIASMEFAAIERAWNFYRSAKLTPIVVRHVEAKLEPQTCGIECANSWDADVRLTYERGPNAQSKIGILSYSGHKEELEFKVEILKSMEGHSTSIYVSEQHSDSITLEPPDLPWSQVALLIFTVVVLVCPAIIAFLPIVRAA